MEHPVVAFNRIEISDPDDPRIAAYRDIRERDLVGREDRFVAEGRVVLENLLSSTRFAAESLLLLENRVDGLSHLLQRVAPDVPVFVAGRAVIDRIVGFPMHRGVLAIGRRGARQTLPAMLAGSPFLLVVLAGIGNHDNVGSIFRNAAAFGAGGVILDDACCDPLYRKAIRVSVGAALTVPFVKGGSIEAIAGQLEAAGYRQLAMSPGARTDLREIGPAPRTALVLGSEGHGLPQQIMQRMMPVRIAMAPGFDSLNVAAASAVALHHLMCRS